MSKLLSVSKRSIKNYSKENDLRPIFNDFIRRDELKKQRKRIMMRKLLWKIPQPEEFSFEGKGHKNLYHFTRESSLNLIMEHGIIFGDVVLSSWDGLNAPNLTTESRFHDPANAEGHIDEEEYYRFKVKCPTDGDKLFNYEWFDKTYCLNTNRNTIRGINQRNEDNKRMIGTYNGNIDKQYIYKGHITPNMIKEVCRWNKETEYWDRVNKKELNGICSFYDSLPFHNMNVFSDYVPVIKTRIYGHQITDDTTGMVMKYHQKTEPKEVHNKLYKMTDWISFNLVGKPLLDWRQKVNQIMEGDRKFDISNLLKMSVLFYNKYNKEDEVDVSQFEEYTNHRKDVYLGVLKEVRTQISELNN
jgi:hypothetical protein